MTEWNSAFMCISTTAIVKILGYDDITVKATSYLAHAVSTATKTQRVKTIETHLPPLTLMVLLGSQRCFPTLSAPNGKFPRSHIGST